MPGAPLLDLPPKGYQPCFDQNYTLPQISWPILNGFACKLYNRAHFCETTDV